MTRQIGMVKSGNRYIYPDYLWQVATTDDDFKKIVKEIEKDGRTIREKY